jgi:hypothetical protein
MVDGFDEHDFWATGSSKGLCDEKSLRNVALDVQVARLLSAGGYSTAGREAGDRDHHRGAQVAHHVRHAASALSAWRATFLALALPWLFWANTLYAENSQRFHGNVA